MKPKLLRFPPYRELRVPWPGPYATSTMFSIFLEGRRRKSKLVLMTSGGV